MPSENRFIGPVKTNLVGVALILLLVAIWVALIGTRGTHRLPRKHSRTANCSRSRASCCG
jgi:hypothetical protein